MNISILSIGNSFSDDLHGHLYEILKLNGYKEIYIANLYIGGCTLKMHFDNILSNAKNYCLKVYDKDGYKEFYNYSILDALDHYYDIITIQQASYESGNKLSYYNEQSSEYISLIHDFVYDNYKFNNKPKFLFHKTWSYDSTFDGDTFKNYDYSTTLMDKKIDECINDIVLKNKYIDGIIDSASIIRKVRKYISFNITRDGYHLSFDLGRYLVGMNFTKELIKNKIIYDKSLFSDELNKIIEKII